MAGGRTPATPPADDPPDTMHPAGVPEADVMSSTYLSLHYHLVFSTKDRAPLIEPSWRNRLHEYLGGTVEGLKGFPQGVGGITDHVHLLVGLKATHCLADFMRELKKASSSWVHDEIKMRRVVTPRCASRGSASYFENHNGSWLCGRRQIWHHGCQWGNRLPLHMRRRRGVRRPFSAHDPAERRRTGAER